MSQPAYAQVAFGSDLFEEDPSVRAVATPLWRESLFALDWMALRTSAVYFGCGVPRGEGQPVVVVPGFLATDFSLSELFGWLARMGYHPYFSRIGRNADCPDYSASMLFETVERAYRETGQKVRLVGHSLGGMLARSVALDHPEHVDRVISMGSPFRDAVRAHPVIIAAASELRRLSRHDAGSNIRPTCFSGHCACGFVRNMLAPDDRGVPTFAIFSKNDGVVAWESCIEDDPVRNDEVNCTHIGMAFHPGVYRALGYRLAQVV